MDLYFPYEHSVINEGISNAIASISYTSAVPHMLSLGKGSQLVKVGLKQVYCNVLVHSQEQHLLIIHNFVGRIYICGLALLFGLRLAPKIFPAFAD